MLFVTTHPDLLEAAARNLAGIGSAMAAGNANAAAPAMAVVPAAAAEILALTAPQFAVHAQMYQTVSIQAAAIHQRLVATSGASAGSYAATGVANAAAAS